MIVKITIKTNKSVGNKNKSIINVENYDLITIPF